MSKDGGIMRTVSSGAMRATRVGAGPAGEPYGRGSAVAQVVVLYYCPGGHKTTVPFISTVTVPPQWECRVCSRSAGTIPIDPPPPDSSRAARYLRAENHLRHVKSRRSAAEGDALMAESLARRDHPEEHNVWVKPRKRLSGHPLTGDGIGGLITAGRATSRTWGQPDVPPGRAASRPWPASRRRVRPGCGSR
jgi:hypothetical protein